ncbi:uncharacterized protein LOC126895392 [Daktulosphaira vitifoliae]|uniref:uncharacterized protein LOC126895392 n=1 Tax=Daktulosphaira vitifoliae TaxID=58002 RepID=UPI0021AA3031|nr:uncharacterized protein LOC126895392 [Daktulosphaira vitifoliae]
MTSKENQMTNKPEFKQQQTQQIKNSTQKRRASVAVLSSLEALEMHQRTISPDEPLLENILHKRNPRPSFVSETKVQYIDRSPINSPVPDALKSPRSSLVPSDHRKSPRFLPDDQKDIGMRSNLSRLEVNDNRNPRHSLTSECLDPRSSRSSRCSLLIDDEYSDMRSGLRLDIENFNRSPRSSNVGLEISRSPKNSLVPDICRSPRGSIAYDLNRSPRGSLTVTPEISRSPRGSLIPDPGRSPRGSVASEGAYNMSRICRGSIPMAESVSLGRTPRGSIGSGSCVHFDPHLKLIKASNESPSDSARTTRLESPKKSNTDKNSQCIQKYICLEDSRRASSSVSQVSSDERKRLCDHIAPCDNGLTLYGSLTFQLNHANMESRDIFDFIIKALNIIYRTVIVTIIMSILTIIPLIMFIVGVQFVRDCPCEPHIPIYMIVGGIFGLIKMVWLLCRQVESLKYDRCQRPNFESGEDVVSSIGSRIASVALSVFLTGWFILGNYWIFSVYWPDSEPLSLYEPNGWCNRTLYIISLVQITSVYLFGTVILGTIIAVVIFQRCTLRNK